MMVWTFVLDPKNPALTIHEVAEHARTLCYPMFVYDGKIYKLTEKTPDTDPGESFEETGSVPEMFIMPSIFCVMDADLKKIAMGDFGPVLFASAPHAQLFAEHVKGVVKSFNEAIYLQNQARKDASPLVLPESAGKIIPARG